VARLVRQLLGIGVGPFEHGELAQREAELSEPARGVRDRLLRTLSRRGGRNHECRPGSGRRGQPSVLLLVARFELIPTDKRQQTGVFWHVRRIWRCPFASGSRRAPPGSLTSGPRAPGSTTCSSRPRTRAPSYCASTTPPWSATAPTRRPPSPQACPG